MTWKLSLTILSRTVCIWSTVKNNLQSAGTITLFELFFRLLMDFVFKWLRTRSMVEVRASVWWCDGWPVGTWKYCISWMCHLPKCNVRDICEEQKITIVLDQNLTRKYYKKRHNPALWNSSVNYRKALKIYSQYLSTWIQWPESKQSFSRNWI